MVALSQIQIGDKRTNGFERRKEQSREKVRKAALELFKAYGFEQVTVTHIARKADVSQVTIYNHFGSKEELVREIIKALLDDILEKYQAILKGDGTFTEKLERLILEKIEILNHFQGELVATMYQCDPKIQQIAEPLTQQKLSHLTIELFNEGKREGYIKAELSDEVILSYYEILRRGILASSRLIGQEYNIKLARELVDLFLNGLVERQGTFSSRELVASQV